MSRRGIKKLFSGCQTCEDIFSLFIAGCSITGEMGSVFVHCLGSLHWQNSQKASIQKTNQGTPFIIVCHIQGHLFIIRRSHSYTCYFLKINCLGKLPPKKTGKCGNFEKTGGGSTRIPLPCFTVFNMGDPP